jgi:DNA-binding transcriptional regulator GbsR (MarR family)
MSTRPEPSDRPALPATVEQFVLEWGDIGSAWGVNRSIAQVHALLYALARPMTAEDISRALDLARSNVSTSLRELQSWQLVHKVPVRGDRRDHFAAESDLWQMAIRIAQGRRTREIDPARSSLSRCLAEASGDAELAPESLGRLRDMHDFVAELSDWYDEILTIPPAKLKRLVSMGRRIARLVS